MGTHHLGGQGRAVIPVPPSKLARSNAQLLATGSSTNWDNPSAPLDRDAVHWKDQCQSLSGKVDSLVKFLEEERSLRKTADFKA